MVHFLPISSALLSTLPNGRLLPVLNRVPLIVVLSPAVEELVTSTVVLDLGQESTLGKDIHMCTHTHTHMHNYVYVHKHTYTHTHTTHMM